MPGQAVNRVAALLAGVLLVAPVGTASAAPCPPVGVWLTEIDFGGGQVEKVWQTYRSRGFCHEGQTEGARAFGRGDWRRTGNRTWTYEVTVEFFDGAGARAGHADMSGRAELKPLRGKSFETAHHVRFFDAGGTLVGEGEGPLTFTKVASGPSC
ncbi:hypothetical protein [Lentzea nigeriaca]|uniref:hypothetical protein n=1 Tax=Lentzea nigeriaca TaxID=1128665 RepID=UPI00195A94B4|nr:hypothetical protein [Lentzea nigeriaca]MBM7862180.1 hypothetical protein [Lentzea nigeriaca]